MALTKVSGSIIKDSVSLSGNVSVGGTLTYQDVTNVDAVGIVTARTGLKVLAGGANIVGVVTATQFKGDGSQLTGISAGVSLSNGADNRVITASSASAIQGEANLTFDGSDLSLTGTFDCSGESTFRDRIQLVDSAPEILLTKPGGGLDARILNDGSGNLIFGNGENSDTPQERLRITSNGALGTNSIVRSAYGGLDLCSQGATNYGTLTLGAGGGQNGQSRNSNQENQFRIMSPTYANPSNMFTVMYGASGSSVHEINYGGGTGWAYAANLHRFFTAANQTTGTGTERLRINSDSSMLHTRSDNTNRYDLEFRNTGGIGNGNYGGIRWTQGSTGSTFLSGIQIAYHDTGRPDLVFYRRDGGGTGSHESMRLDRDGNLSLNGDGGIYLKNSGTNTWQVQVGGNVCTEFASNRRVRMPQVYSTAGSSMRDVQVESDGTLCGQSSIRAAKKNIVSQTDVSWLYDLNPVTFNYRKHTVHPTTGVNTYLEEIEEETSYGLIAEEVETVNKDFCFYDNDGDLMGVYYKQLITPLLKALQDQKKEIDTLKAEVAALKSS